ncbi:MAG: recombination mediator RecR [Clostridia bacterium]|nr:recombination mediator RecR [Clostridia bacterium]
MARDITALTKLIEHFQSFPGVGNKSAQRMAFAVMNMDKNRALDFANSIMEVKKTVQKCKFCCNLTDREICDICDDSSRDKTVICVVEDPRDVTAIENTNNYKGLYHVLHGALSPLNGIGPDDLTIGRLLERLDGVKEVIMATNLTGEGDTTATYISRLLKPLGVKTTRLAYGMPVGANLEYADIVTLSKAMEGRSEI